MKRSPPTERMLPYSSRACEGEPVSYETMQKYLKHIAFLMTDQDEIRWRRGGGLVLKAQTFVSLNTRLERNEEEAARRTWMRTPDGSPTVPTTHYTLHTAHYTLHTTHCTLHTAHCTLHTTHYILHTARCTLHTTSSVEQKRKSLSSGAARLSAHKKQPLPLGPP